MAMAPKGASPKKAGAAGAEAKAAIELPEWVSKRISDLEDTIRLAKTPAEKQLAVKEYEEVIKAISTDLRIAGRQVAPNAKTITYDMGNGKFTSRPRGEPAPEGGKAINYTEEQVRNLLPPKPVVETAKEAAQTAAPIHPAAARRQAVVDLAKEVAKPRTVPPSMSGTTPQMTPKSPWERPGFTPRLSPTQPEALTPRVRDLFDPALVLGAGAAGAYALDPNATKTIAQNILQPPYKPQGETNPNLDNLQGPGVSYSPEDFESYNVPNNPDFNPHMWNPPVSSAQDYSGRENPQVYKEYPDVTPPTPEQSGRELGPFPERPMGQEQRFAPMSRAMELAQPNEPRRFPAVSAAQTVLRRAQNTPAAQAQQAAAVLQQSPNELTVQKGADQGPSAFTRFIRGDFREGADQRIMEAMRRQREESGVDSSTMARGGSAPKKSSKDDVLHKALEIIHHMLTRR